MSNGAGRDNLIPRLADRYRVIARDHLGFRLSDASPVDEFDNTFDAQTDPARGATLALEVVSQALRAFRRPDWGGEEGLRWLWFASTMSVDLLEDETWDELTAASLSLHETAIARTGHPDGAFGCVV